MTRLTAYEICSHRNDLHFVTHEVQGRHHFIISRGPGHNFKPLISTRIGFDSREEAAGKVGEQLAAARETTQRELGDEGLTEEQIRHIVAELRETGTASTFSSAST